MLSPTRMYKGLPAKTIGVHQTVRVNIHGQSTVKIAEVSKPPACRAHQFTGGRVWAYVADPNYSCCKTNNCLSHFDPSDPRIIEARAPLFEISLTAPQRRFICHHPTRQELYNQYILDARDDTSGTLYKCHVDYFLATLKRFFPRNPHAQTLQVRQMRLLWGMERQDARPVGWR